MCPFTRTPYVGMLSVSEWLALDVPPSFWNWRSIQIYRKPIHSMPLLATTTMSKWARARIQYQFLQLQLQVLLLLLLL